MKVIGAYIITFLALPIRVIRAMFEDRDGYISRKLAAAWALSFLTSIQLILHIPITLMFGVETSQMLSSADFVQFLTVIWGAYFAADTASNWIYRKANNDEEKVEGEDNG
jgi:hypothetical protein